MRSDFSAIKSDMTAAGTEILSIPDRRRGQITQISGLFWKSAVKTRAGGFFPDFRAAIDAGVIAGGWRLFRLAEADKDAANPERKVVGLTANFSTNEGRHPS